MPSTKPKTARKKPARKSAPRAKKASTKSKPPKDAEPILESMTPEEEKGTAPRYIPISNDDSEFESRNKLTWLIVIAIGLGIVVFWFWSLRQNISKMGSGEDLQTIAKQVSQNVADLKNLFSEVKTGTQEQLQQYKSAQEIEALKNSTLKQIELNLDSGTWPEHISEPLKISLKYPSTWSKTDDGKTIALASYPDQNNLPESLGQLIITQQKVSGQATLTDWADKNLGDEYLFEKEIFVDFQPALKYQQQTATSTDISYSVFVQKNNAIYEIKAYSRNGQSIYESILEKIISTINFLQ